MKRRTNLRAALAFAHDMGAVALAWLGAFWFRLNFDWPDPYASSAVRALIWILPIHALIFFKTGLYRGIWRYASIPDLRNILGAVGAGALITAAVVHAAAVHGMPRSILALYPLLLVIAMGGTRFLYRSWKDGHLIRFDHADATAVLVVGAGDAGAALVRELSRNARWDIIGFVDEDPARRGMKIYGFPVLGGLDDIESLVERHDLEVAIIALPEATAARRRQATERATSAGLAVLTVPTLDDLLSGKVSISQVKRVELEDLVGRQPVKLDTEGLHKLLENRAVLLTGAGGSIGSELVKQIAKYRPRLLILYELAEFSLYRIEQELRTSGFHQIACIAGDVKDGRRLDEIFSSYRPEVVFHAAAYKHVPLMERDNAWEAVRNNVLGTLRVARTAAKHRVEKFVLVSTDKAVNPTNVMGSSKRLAEIVCQQYENSCATHFIVVRFGNVLGSSGSVIPKFREQIARGGPVTVTHPEITRYFMSIPEAAQLVMQAALMGRGGEIFVLDMGEPVKIADLARDMIRLSGFTEDEIKIEFTGLRPGEKLYEELLADDEHTLPTPHPKLRVARARECLGESWLKELEQWLTGEPPENDARVRWELKERVPEYKPAEATEPPRQAPRTTGITLIDTHGDLRDRRPSRLS